MGKAVCNKDKSECEKCRWRTAALSIGANLFLAVFKVFIGFITGSQAVLADAVHSGADAFNMVIAVIGMRVGDKPADQEHTYGHGKVEFIVGLFGGIMLLVVAYEISFNAIRLLFFTNQHLLKTPMLFAVWAPILSIYINFVMSHYTMCAAKQLNSAALEVIGADDISDVYSSSAVAIAVIGTQFGLRQLDPFGALFVGLLVAKLGFGLVKKNYNEIIDVSIEPKKVQEIGQIITNLHGVKGIRNLRTRSVGRKIWVDVQILVEGNKTIAQADYLVLSVKNELKKQIPDLLNAQVIIKPLNGR